MHSHKAADLSDSSANAADENSSPSAQSDQTDRSDKEVMCLVHPDGKLITVELEPDSD